MNINRVAALLLLIPQVATASHEDMGLGARAAGMAESFTAIGDDLWSIGYNPGALGQIGQSQAALSYRRGFLAPAGPADFDRTAWAAAAPLRLIPLNGVLGVHGIYTTIGQVSLERNVGVSYATRGWREVGNGLLDIGASLNALGRSGRAVPGSVTKAGVDIGALYNVGDAHTFGASILNLNGPRTDIGGVADIAPVIAKLGYARDFGGHFIVALDGALREPSGGRRASQSGAIGIERWLHSVRYGSFAARSGLNLGSASRSWSLGAGWRMLGASLDYSLILPLGYGERWSNAVSLLVRFGAWNAEKEYEKILSSEMRYRRDLTRALESSESRQRKLSEQLSRASAELQKLKEELADKSADAQSAHAKIEALAQRQREAERRYQEIEAEKASLRLKSKSSLFREDWQAYQKLKLGGAPDSVLLERAKILLREYKDSGADLSELSQEYLRLLRNRPDTYGARD